MDFYWRPPGARRINSVSPVVALSRPWFSLVLLGPGEEGGQQTPTWGEAGTWAARPLGRSSADRLSPCDYREMACDTGPIGPVDEKGGGRRCCSACGVAQRLSRTKRNRSRLGLRLTLPWVPWVHASFPTRMCRWSVVAGRWWPLPPHQPGVGRASDDGVRSVCRAYPCRGRAAGKMRRSWPINGLFSTAHDDAPLWGGLLCHQAGLRLSPSSPPPPSRQQQTAADSSRP